MKVVKCVGASNWRVAVNCYYQNTHHHYLSVDFVGSPFEVGPTPMQILIKLLVLLKYRPSECRLARMSSNWMSAPWNRLGDCRLTECRLSDRYPPYETAPLVSDNSRLVAHNTSRYERLQVRCLRYVTTQTVELHWPTPRGQRQFEWLRELTGQQSMLPSHTPAET